MTDPGASGTGDGTLPSPFEPQGSTTASSERVQGPIDRGANAPARRPEIGRGTISDIPAYWGSDSGDLSVTLSFRVGAADETLRTRGLCSLVAQLAIMDLDDDALDITTAVSPLLTSFTIAGPDAAVAHGVTALARAMSALPMHRLDEAIAEILDAWSPPRRWDIELMTLRFGARGYGLPASELLGLHDLDPRTLETWQRTWFTAGNAVLHCNREPSTPLDLGALPDGDRKPLPDPHPIDLELPALFPGPDHTVAASFLSRFQPSLERALELLGNRFRTRFGELDPRIGEVDVDVQPSGSGFGTITIFVPAPNELAVEVRDIMSSELFRFAMNGPTDDELEQAEIAARRNRDRKLDDTAHLAARAAADDLLGASDRPRSDSAEPDPSDLATVVRRMSAHAIWLMPRGTDVRDRRLARIPEGSAEVLQGNVFTPVAEISASRRQDRLVVASDGLTLLIDGALPATVRFADCVSIQHWSDGARTIWGADGIRFLVHPATWLGGTDVIEWIDSQVEPWLNIEMRAPSGYILPIDAAVDPTR